MAYTRALSYEQKYEQMIQDVRNLKNDMGVVREIVGEQNKVIESFQQYINTPRQTPRYIEDNEEEEEKKEEKKEEKNSFFSRKNIIISCTVGAVVGLAAYLFKK